MNDRVLDTCILESRNNLAKHLGFHLHGIGLAINLIQVRPIDYMLVVILFAKNESSSLVAWNTSHVRPGFMPGHHLKRSVGLAESVCLINN